VDLYTKTTRKPEAKQRVHIDLFDGLRGMASLKVVIFHLFSVKQLASSMENLPGPIVFFFEEISGVAIFFVMSGLLMTMSLDSWLERPARISALNKNVRFLTKRIIRLTPPYYAAILFALVMAFGAAIESGERFNPGLSEFTIGRLLAHLVYLQELLGFDHFNDVFWTMAIELQFDIVLVGFWYLRKLLTDSYGARIGNSVIFLVSALSLMWPMGLFEVSGRSPYFTSFWYSFISGVLLYLNLKSQLSNKFTVLYTLLLISASLLGGPNGTFIMVTAATNIVVLVAIEFSKLDKWLAHPFFKFFGRISYSLYLTHTPILGAVTTIVFLVAPVNGLWKLIAALLSVLASIVFASLFYKVFEQRAIAMSKKVT